MSNPMTPQDTPLTDELEQSMVGDDAHCYGQMIEHARSLERRLAAAERDAALAKAAALHLWQPCNQWLPEPGVRVLVHCTYFNKRHSVLVAKLPTYPVRADWYPNGCWIADNDEPSRAEIPAEYVTYWQPLPTGHQDAALSQEGER